MRKTACLTTTILIGFLGVLAEVRPALAQPVYGLEYYGGPILESFTMHPLYYGDWSKEDIEAQQSFLDNLADYISGKNAPAGQQPIVRQYGVVAARVAAAKTASPGAAPIALSYTDISNIIHANQLSGNLPPFGPHTLILFFPAHGFTIGTVAYHASESDSAFWLVVPRDACNDNSCWIGPIDPVPFQLVTSHEVFESATDPGVGMSPPCGLLELPCGPGTGPTSWGWLTDSYLLSGSPHADEAVDECDLYFVNDFITLKNLGNIQILLTINNTLGVQIPSALGQPLGGVCSTTGYDSMDEVEVYGVPLGALKSIYAALRLRPAGWRLYMLQSYVSPSGDVLYNAVWRPTGNTDEQEDYGVTFAQFQSDNTAFSGNGYRLYILQSYVLPPTAGPLAGEVRYNAVWRPGAFSFEPDYGVTLAQYEADYATNFTSQERLFSLQAYVRDLCCVFYNALWRQGISNENALYAMSAATFASTYSSMHAAGWRLYLLQSYVLGGEILYNAVWRPGSHEEIEVHGVSYAQYITEFNELWTEGYRLYILDTFVQGTDVRYNAVWRKGTIDRPL